MLHHFCNRQQASNTACQWSYSEQLYTSLISVVRQCVILTSRFLVLLHSLVLVHLLILPVCEFPEISQMKEKYNQLINIVRSNLSFLSIITNKLVKYTIYYYIQNRPG